MAWGYNCSRVAKLQKKIIRTICVSKYNAHTEPLFKKLGLLNINDILKHNVLKFYYKLKNDKVPVYFTNYHALSQLEIHGRDTRYNDRILYNITRTRIQQNCLRNYIPEIISSMPPNILEKIHTHSYQGFSNYVKQFLIGKYSTECNIPNCYICEN